MNWLSLQDQAGDFLPVSTFLDGVVFAPSNEKPTVKPTSLRGKRTASYFLSRSGRTFVPSTDARGVDLWMSSLAVSRVNRGVSQGSGRGRQTTATSGRTRRESFAKLDLSSSSWRTSQISLLTGTLDEYSQTWPRSGIVSHGTVSPHQPSAPITKGTGFGFLPIMPTPTSSLRTEGDFIQAGFHSSKRPTYKDAHFPTPIADDAKNVSRKAGDFTSLTRFVQMFPTPATIDSGSGMINRSPSPGAASRPTLAMMARKDLWPTPIAADGGKHSPAVRHKGGNHTLTSAVLFHTPTAMDATRGDYQYDRGDKTKKRPSLRAQARNFPTPRHRDYKGTAQSHEYKSQEALPNQDRGDGQPIGGKLNPTWVEWLMDWPIGWTSLEVLLPSIVEDWRIKNGCTQKRTDAEGLRGMRDDNDSAPMGERETGQHLFEQEVLQLKVLRSDDGNTESHQRDIPQEGTEGGANEVVRELRGDTQSPETSPRHHETDGGDSALSELPYPSRHATWEMGTWWEQEPDIPRVVSGITERVNRLKAIGDGQVPIVVATAFHVLYHRLVERTP